MTGKAANASSDRSGTTRNNFEGKTVLRLEYEAYEPMAKKELLKVCAEARKRFPSVDRIAIAHRLGLVFRVGVDWQRYISRVAESFQ